MIPWISWNLSYFPGNFKVKIARLYVWRIKMMTNFLMDFQCQIKHLLSSFSNSLVECVALFSYAYSVQQSHTLSLVHHYSNNVSLCNYSLCFALPIFYVIVTIILCLLEQHVPDRNNTIASWQMHSKPFLIGQTIH